MNQTDENKKRRFVVLFHEFPDGHQRADHWDLMLEHDEGILTWALNTHPQPGPDIGAIRLADHRKHYLSFEGPIGEDRGSVTQLMSGEYELDPTGGRVIVTLAGDLNEDRNLQPSRGLRQWEIKFVPFDADVGEAVTISIQAIPARI